MGGLASGNESDSSGKSKWTSAAQESLSATQTPFLTDLWGLGGKLADKTGIVNSGVNAGKIYAQRVLGDTYNPLLSSYNQTYGGGNAYNTATSKLLDPLVSGLTNIVNQPAPVFGAGGSNPLLDKNVGLALEQASTDLSRNLLPQIGRDAQSAGQYGGSRQGIAEGIALSDANRNALQTAMGAYGDQYASDRAANLASQQQADATRLAAAQQIQDIMAGQGNNTAQGVQTGQQMVGLGMAPSDIYAQLSNAQWNPLMNYANILGQPIVLGQANSSGSSKSSSSGQGFKIG